MDLSPPRLGEVIRYAYLRANEADLAREEGVKHRPCAVVLALRKRDEQLWVTVAPVTHAPPRDAESAVELSASLKKRLGLDARRSWVICHEVNEFTWPGPDLRAIPARKEQTVRYGFLPTSVLQAIARKMVAHARRMALRRTVRTK